MRPKPIKGTDLLTVEEAAELVAETTCTPCNVDTIHRALRTGKLTALREDPIILYRPDVLQYSPPARVAIGQQPLLGTDLDYILESDYLAWLVRKTVRQAPDDALTYYDKRRIHAQAIGALPTFSGGEPFWSRTFGQWFHRTVKDGKITFLRAGTFRQPP